MTVTASQVHAAALGAAPSSALSRHASERKTELRSMIIGELWR
jgi:hypothetical protein